MVSGNFAVRIRPKLNIMYSTGHHIVCFKASAESDDVATRTAEPGQLKTAQKSQRSEGDLQPCAGGGGGFEVLMWP